MSVQEQKDKFNKMLIWSIVKSSNIPSWKRPTRNKYIHWITFQLPFQFTWFGFPQEIPTDQVQMFTDLFVKQKELKTDSVLQL